MDPGKEILIDIYDILGKKMQERHCTSVSSVANNFPIGPNVIFHSGLLIVMVSDASTRKMLYTQKLLIR